MATTVTHATLSASDHSAQLRKAVIASTIGTAIEWYDFFLYGTQARAWGYPIGMNWIFGSNIAPRKAR
jgi:hypothetical protein